MSYFPFFIDIKNRKCIVVGGGTVALRKIEKLVLFEPQITVISPIICDEISKLPGIGIVRREFKDSDIDGAFLVITATDNSSLNERIFQMCSDKGIPVNTVDDKEKCSFIFPAIVKRENVTAAVSTEGKSPIFARYLRQSIERSLDDRTDRIVGILSGVRNRIKSEINDEENRKLAFEKILTLLLKDSDNVTSETITEIIGEYR